MRNSIPISPSPLTRRSPRGRCGLRFAFGRRLHCFDASHLADVPPRRLMPPWYSLPLPRPLHSQKTPKSQVQTTLRATALAKNAQNTSANHPQGHCTRKNSPNRKCNPLPAPLHSQKQPKSQVQTTPRATALAKTVEIASATRFQRHCTRKKRPNRKCKPPPRPLHSQKTPKSQVQTTPKATALAKNAQIASATIYVSSLVPLKDTSQKACINLAFILKKSIFVKREKAKIYSPP